MYKRQADLCTDIIANNNAYKLAVAGVNGQQWNWLKQVETATSNVEVDAILEELALWDKGRQQALRN